MRNSRNRDDRLWQEPLYEMFTFRVNNPPYVPRLGRNSSPEYADILPEISTALGNFITDNADRDGSRTSPVWIYLFNLCSERGWSNDIFATLVNITYDFVVTQVESGSMRANTSAFEKAAESIATGFASEIASKNQDLMDAVSDREYDDILDNAEVFSELVESLTRTSRRGSRGSMRDRDRRDDRHRDRDRGHVRRDRGAGRDARASAVTPSFGALSNKRRQEMDQDRAPRAPRQRLDKDVQEDTQVTTPPPAPAAVTKPKTDDTVLQGENMEHTRELHRHPYLNQIFPQEVPEPKTRDLEAAIDEITMAISTGKDVEIISANNMASIEQAILCEQAAVLDTKTRFTPYIACLGSPVISGIDLTDFMKAVETMFSFVDIVNGVKKFANEHLENYTSSTRKYHVAWVTQVDRILTDVINNWLGNAFGAKGPSIDSFMADIKDVLDYVKNKYGIMAASNFNAMEKRFMVNFRNSFAEQLKERDPSLQSAVAFEIPTEINVTYINEAASTLNYGFKKVGALMEVNPVSTPVLYAALVKLHRLGGSYSAIRNIVLLADGSSYEYYMDANDSEKIYIKER